MPDPAILPRVIDDDRTYLGKVQRRYIRAHMKAVDAYAALSCAQRGGVGAVVVKDDTIIAIGYNGTPPGWDNCCETPDGSTTLPEVVHAEQNALDKLMRGTTSSVGSTMFCSVAPCIDCAKRIHGARLEAVYYQRVYRNDLGLQYLQRAGVACYEVSPEIMYPEVDVELPPGLDEKTKADIRAVFLNYGFTIKQGQTDLKPYVFMAGFRLLTSYWARLQGRSFYISRRALQDALKRLDGRHPEIPQDSMDRLIPYAYRYKQSEDDVEIALAPASDFQRP